MRRACLFTVILFAGVLAVLLANKLLAAETPSFQTTEYGTIRWGGRDNTHFIRPNGKVEFLGPILTKVSRPDRADERAFYMSLAINAVAREGFELAGMTSDEVVMKRPVSR